MWEIQVSRLWEDFAGAYKRAQVTEGLSPSQKGAQTLRARAARLVAPPRGLPAAWLCRSAAARRSACAGKLPPCPPQHGEAAPGQNRRAGVDLHPGEG